jgi:hypothetical protein
MIVDRCENQTGKSTAMLALFYSTLIRVVGSQRESREPASTARDYCKRGNHKLAMLPWTNSG